MTFATVVKRRQLKDLYRTAAKKPVPFKVNLAGSGGIMRIRGDDVPRPELNDALEQQARQIGQALHDDCGQLLAGVYLALADVNRNVPPTVRTHLHKITHLLDEFEDGLRQFSHELHPAVLDDLGLAAALQLLRQGVSRRAGISVSILCPKHRQLPRAIELALYRVAQEALSNVMRHARAAHVRIWIHLAASKVLCLISDDGIGFRVTSVLGRKGQSGLGMRGIRARIEALGGKFSVRSAVGHGTTLRAIIPLKRNPF